MLQPKAVDADEENEELSESSSDDDDEVYLVLSTGVFSLNLDTLHALLAAELTKIACSSLHCHALSGSSTPCDVAVHVHSAAHEFVICCRVGMTVGSYLLCICLSQVCC